MATLASTALSVGLVLATPAASQADSALVPGTMSSDNVGTSTFSVPVPSGVVPSAISAILTQPALVEGGTVVFSVNGRPVLSVASTLYRKVSIPVTPADVVADGTIALSVSTAGVAAAGATCTPPAGTAALRRIALQYTGVETAPTSPGTFFPPSSAGVNVQIPQDADQATITAGLTAVAALAVQYDDDTPIALVTKTPASTKVVATQRLVVLTPGPAGEVNAEVSSTNGVPTLTLTGSGDALVAAARALSTETLGLSGTSAQNPSQQAKPRNTATTRTLGSLQVGDLTLSGYGSVTRDLELRQDSFGQPVDSMKVHLEGTHTAFAEGSGARLDIRANGALVASQNLGQESAFSVDFSVPANELRSVNDLSLTLNALAPDGSACTPASVPAAEVDIDTASSTVAVTPGTGEAEGFQLFPQILEGTLPVALKAVQGEATAAINAAAIIVDIQRAAGSLLDIQLMTPDRFLADDRSGLFIGAVASDSQALDAPLKLSATRLLDREDSTVEVTSQDPYAVLESIDRDDRLVLMLGSWATGDKAADGILARKVVDFVGSTGWADLEGDLVIADEANPAFATASRSLAPHQEVEEETSYAKWFVAGIALLLLLLALQVFLAIRRDRRVSRAEEEEPRRGPAYVEDEAHEVDDLGDVDDLDVLEGTDDRGTTPAPPTAPPAQPKAAPTTKPRPKKKP
ncbi:cellulose biosynthesis cyclic di-GMP-binding regulatory protein BcsB [Nocardioides flavescens]|uniref:Cellulose biosynthesis cyclic di-GMP-binding regulatory protein BcsB n=1 Tax=Nocardioides flavescens TaxID=2691959 RepID=A0A6L7F438_9ACTN|nr:hypothetical protein [Nocardioides flavescens]